MGEKPRLELLGGLRSLYRSRDYSDLAILAGDTARHPVHRAVVCPRSAYLEDCVKQGRWKNGVAGEIELVDEEPEVIRLLVEYLYLLDYEPVAAASPVAPSSRGDSSDTMSVRTEAGQYLYGASAVSAFGGPQHVSFPTIYRHRTESSLTVHARPEGEIHGFTGHLSNRRRPTRSTGTPPPEPSPLATADPNLLLHARMYTAGHKYGIEGLKALALDKFKIQSTRHWDSQEFAQAINVVYDTTPSSDKDMRVAVAEVLDWHSRLLDKPEIEFAIMEINGLAYELLRRSRRAQPEYMS